MYEDIKNRIKSQIELYTYINSVYKPIYGYITNNKIKYKTDNSLYKNNAIDIGNILKKYKAENSNISAWIVTSRYYETNIIEIRFKSHYQKNSDCASYLEENLLINPKMPPLKVLFNIPKILNDDEIDGLYKEYDSLYKEKALIEKRLSTIKNIIREV